MSSVSAYNKAVELLARREHSHYELKNKLLGRDYTEQEIEPALIQLEQENYLSDVRFAESYVRLRVEKGFGARKIKAELYEKGINSELASLVLAKIEDWQPIIEAAYQKRFIKRSEDVNKEKVYRFLSYRGFTSEQIRRVV